MNMESKANKPIDDSRVDDDCDRMNDFTFSL